MKKLPVTTSIVVDACSFCFVIGSLGNHFVTFCIKTRPKIESHCNLYALSLHICTCLSKESSIYDFQGGLLETEILRDYILLAFRK